MKRLLCISAVLTVLTLAASLLLGTYRAPVVPAAAPPFIPPNPAAIHQLVNYTRRQYGLAPLSYDSRLQAAAAYKCGDMQRRGYFAHNSPAGQTMLAVTDLFVTPQPGALVGQNLAKGIYSSPAVFKAWMASPEHRANILNGSYTAEGLAYCSPFVVEDFAQL